jgi:hypothetical protein
LIFLDTDFVITTNHILGEVLTLLRTRGKQDDRSRHGRAVAIGRKIYGGPSAASTR